MAGNPYNLDINADKAAAAMCRRSLSFFIKEFWDTIIEDELEWAPHMGILCDEIQKVYERVFARIDPETKKPVRLPKLYDLIINIPPGTTKSTICTIMAPIWSWSRDPSLRHITASFAESLSTGHAVKSRDILRSDKFRRYFPHIQIKKDQDNKTDYTNTANGQRYVTSVGASPTGVHAHIITIDDPLNPKEAISEVGLENAIKFFDDTISTRKVDKRVTPLILIMQRLHVKDPTGHLLEKKKGNIRHICLPGTLTENVQPKEYRSIYVRGYLDPIRLGPQQLKELKVDLGSYNYAGQIEQTPVPPGGIIWQKWLIELEDWDFPDPVWGENYSTDWDLAYTEKETNAASAYITSFKYKGKLYIDDLDWDWLEFPELIKWMKTKQGPHYIEAKACFAAGTLVRTWEGLKSIDKIKAGEKVLSFNLETKQPEYKKVLNTFAFPLPPCYMKLCIFTFSNGLTIKCTLNHEFYINGNWVAASVIAQRIMEMGAGNEQSLFDLQFGQIDNNKLQRQIRKRSSQGNETCIRSVWVLKNYARNKRKVQNAKNTSGGCTSIYSESFKSAIYKSYQLQSFGQQGRKSRMGNPFSKQSSFFGSWSAKGICKGNETKESINRFESSQCNPERANSKRNQAEIQAENIYKTDVSGRVWNKYPQRYRSDIWPGLEACEINLRNIVSVEIIYSPQNVYDLHVQDNSNYCITADNIIVHNSGKSAKQTLTDQGIIAVEVPVPGGTDKEARARMATPMAEAGMIYIRKKLAEALYHDSKQGILFFPRGAYADLADVLAQCILRTRVGSRGSVRVMEDTVAIEEEAGLDIDEVFKDY